MHYVSVDASGRIVARNLHREALARMVVATIDEAKALKEAQTLLDAEEDRKAAEAETSTPKPEEPAVKTN